MSSPMRQAAAVQHPNLAASPWATMDSLGYGSDGDDEFRSPNGLDLETSSEEDSPTNHSTHTHAGPLGAAVPQSRVPGGNDPVPWSANVGSGYGSEKNAQDAEAEYRLRVQMAYNRGDMAELEKVLIETKDAPALSQLRKLTKKALKKLLAQRVLDEPLTFGAPAQEQASLSQPPSYRAAAGGDVPPSNPLKPSMQDSGIGIARKNDNTCVMDLLPGVVGWVIGRAGTRIKEIQGQSGCKMWVDQDVPDDQPRKLYFHGSKPNIDTAVQLVNELLKSAPILAGKHGQVSRLTSHIMDCPPDLVGLLIGKKGWTIKKIQQESGAQISINQSVREGLPRKIIISGTEDAVHAAIGLIEEVLKNKSEVPTRYVTVEETVRTISLPTTISAAGLATARAVPPGRVVATNGARPVYTTDGMANAVFQQELTPETPARLNSAPPGFHIPVPGQQMGSVHAVPRSQTRSASPQLITSPQHGAYFTPAQLGGYGDASTMTPTHAQQPVNPAFAYAQHQQQQQAAWQQHQLHLMQMQQQQQQHVQAQPPQQLQQQHQHHHQHIQMQQHVQAQTALQGGFHHTGYQQQLEQAVTGATGLQPQHAAQVPPTYAAAAAAVAPAPAPGPAVAAAQSPSALARTMQALSISEDAAVDTLLNAAAVVSQSGVAAAPAPSITAAAADEWQPAPPASAASPLWQPTSMLPTDTAPTSEPMPALSASSSALTFDALSAGPAADLPLAAAAGVLSAAAATSSDSSDASRLASVGLSSETQSLLLGSSAGAASGWERGLGQTF